MEASFLDEGRDFSGFSGQEEGVEEVVEVEEDMEDLAAGGQEFSEDISEFLDVELREESAKNSCRD